MKNTWLFSRLNSQKRQIYGRSTGLGKRIKASALRSKAWLFSRLFSRFVEKTL
jgi:hypothetical protein